MTSVTSAILLVQYYITGCFCHSPSPLDTHTRAQKPLNLTFIPLGRAYN